MLTRLGSKIINFDLKRKNREKISISEFIMHPKLNLEKLGLISESLMTWSLRMVENGVVMHRGKNNVILDVLVSLVFFLGLFFFYTVGEEVDRG